MKRQKDDFLKKVIIILGIFLLLFTVAMIIVFCVTGGSEPSTLIACVFAAAIGEGSICGMIQKAKKKKPEEEEEYDEGEEE